MSATETQAIVQGRPVPAELLGELRDSARIAGDGAALRARLSADGYLLLCGAIPRGAVRAARQEVLARLVEVDEIEPPTDGAVIEGIVTGRSRRRELAGDLGAFWRNVSQGPALRRVSHGPEVLRLMTTVLGEAAAAHDYLFLRVGPPGRFTDLHYDHPFFARGSQRVHTCWIALGDVPVAEGPLMIVEGSQHFADLLEPALQIDYDSGRSPRVAAGCDAVTLAQQRGARLLTTGFRAGDLVLFPMTTLHGALDNHSPAGRARVSCDVRYQPQSDPIDPRYVGAEPPGTTGAGYGELNGAKPLTEPWHVR